MPDWQKTLYGETTRAFSPSSANTIRTVSSGVKAVSPATSGLRGSTEGFARNSGPNEIVVWRGRSLPTRVAKKIVREAYLFTTERLTTTPRSSWVQGEYCPPLWLALPRSKCLNDTPFPGHLNDQVQAGHWGASTVRSKRSVLLKSGYMNV